MIITREYLIEHPDHIFVFGDNTKRVGRRGAAILRYEPNTYGFITKRYPSNDDDAFFMNNAEYRRIFYMERCKLEEEIKAHLDKTYLISKLGAGLANKYNIWEKVIQPGLEPLRKYPNVIFLWEVFNGSDPS
jgi:hypothetical protein